MSSIKPKRAQLAAGALAAVAGLEAATKNDPIGDLAGRLADSDFEKARAAGRATWRIVRHAGRPGADDERKDVVASLIPLLKEGQPGVVYREVLWMLSEIGGDESVEPIAALLSNTVAREDARMALERIPGDASLGALKAQLDVAPDDFRINIAQSLRARGTEVPGLPCGKLKPVKQTAVRPMGP